jgi:4-hydroxybenzoate polyprenyltransferase
LGKNIIVGLIKSTIIVQPDLMGLKIIKFIFFGNYFIGLLAVALTIESTIQLHLPFNSLPYYILISLTPIVYYTYAYMGVNKLSKTSNPRTQWYIAHKELVKWSQIILSAICLLTVAYLLMTNIQAILHLPLLYWMEIAFLLLAALLYYGLLPSYFFNLNLRNTGWLKPFIIGFVWACTANLLPLIALKIEAGINQTENILWIWLFIKNWMFCTVNAIMFDLKDYAIDANKELKTFVVRIGLKQTIYKVLVPLLCIGMFSLIIFTYIAHFHLITILFNLIPFVLTLIVAYSLNERKKILFYLIVIDGLILIKALCGMAGVLLLPN